MEVKPRFLGLTELVLRQCVFLIINIYRISKILGGQFYMKGKLPPEIANTTLGEASGFSLAWTFMGHSYLYVLFVGLLQLVGAWFLLWSRTKLLGVLILIPIILNIIVFDLIFLDVYPALVNAIIVFAMLMLILFYNKERVTTALKKVTDFPKSSTPLKRRFLSVVITVIMIALIFLFDSLIENWLGASKEKIGY